MESQKPNNIEGADRSQANCNVNTRANLIVGCIAATVGFVSIYLVFMYFWR